MQLSKMKICLALLCGYLIPIYGRWTLEGSSSVAVVGTDFTLTCTVPQNTAAPTYVLWTRGVVINFIFANTCKDTDANNPWPSYIYTCNNQVFTLTIPGDDIDPDNDNNAQWKCSDGSGASSNLVTIIVLDPVQQITMNGTTPLVVHEGSTVTIMCTTSPSRPAAYVVWYKDTNNITSDATDVVENQAGDKYVTRSYLSLTGNRGDEGKTIKCEGYNGAPNKVSDSATLEIWYPPPNIQTLAGYMNNTIKYVRDYVTLTCRQEGGNPFSNLSLTCNGKTGVARGSSTGSLVELELTLDSSYNGKTCSCVSTHVVNNYRKVVSIVLSVHYAPVSLPQIGGYSNSTALNDGSTVTVTCTQKGGFPLSDITWNCMGHSGNTQKSGGQSTSSVTFSIDRTYNQKTCTCTATHPDPNVNYSKSESVVFTVYYAPRPTNKPTLSGYVNGTALLEDSTAKHELICRQSDCNPLCALTWNCEGLTGTNASTQTEAVSIIQVPLQRQYNGKTCKCTARHTSLAYTEHVSVNFTVHYSPSQPSISVSPTFPWLEKTRGSLYCNVADKGNPPLTSYTWLDGSGATAGQSDETFSIDVLTNFDDGRKISCRVKNSVSAAMTSEVITLNVEYSPIITVDKTNLTIIEGERAERICTAKGNPEPNVKWMKGSTIVDGGVGTSATLTIPNISRTATGVYTCHAEAVSAVASRNKLSSSQDTNLIVQYPPDVHIQLSNATEYTTNVQLICFASGVPPVYTYIGWKQMIGQSTIRTEFAGLSDDGRMLTFDNVTFADSGLYSCEVSNKIKYPKTATNYFDVKAAAKFKPDTKTYTFYSRLKQKLTVTIPFYSNPKALLSDIKWNNLSENSLIKQTENTTFDVYNSLFNISLHSVTASLHGQNARMTISSFEGFHQGNYSVTISNRLGSTSNVAFWIIPSGPPDTPTNFDYVSISTTSIAVKWSKGFNGGHPQTFVVWYQDDGDKKEREIKETSDTDYTLLFDQLQSQNLYTLFLYSYNIEGISKENITLIVTTLKAVEEAPLSSPAAYIGGGTAGGLCLIAILVGGIFFIKRRQAKQKDGDTILMNRRQAYEELGLREQDKENQYQELQQTSSRTTEDASAQVYDVLGRREPQQEYEQIKPKQRREGPIYENTLIK